MKTKGQHRGHCQKCGAIQVVLPSGTLADHGYTVPNGYFRGICQGSHELPLQVSRVITDAIIVAMNDLSARNEAHASALRSGMLKPEKVQRLTSWGAREYTYEGSKQIPLMREWLLANGDERKAQVELEASQAESDARFFRGHAKSMSELATRVHGTALIDRDAEELARVAERKAKTAPIAGAYRTKIEQKRALEVLSREYSKARTVITNRYLDDVRRSPRVEVSQDYYTTPYDLHQWREKHSDMVLKVYPELNDTINQIRGLVIAREEIKARPVIK
jgi:hypothetical protein